MRATRIAFVVAIAGFAVACLFPSLGDLTETKDSGGSDAPSDVASPADASNDAPPTFCSDSSARFCEDFDDSDASKFLKWPSQLQQDGVKITRDVSDASAPFGVRFIQVGLDAGNPFGAMEHDFLSAPITSSVHLTFDFRIDQFPSSGDLKPIAVIQFDATLWPNIDDCVALALQPSSAALFEGVPTDAGNIYPFHALSQTVPQGKWTHVDLSLIFSPGNISATLQFDGATVLPPTTLDSRVTYAAPAVQLGFTAMDPWTSSSVLLDNVTFDWQ